MFEFTAEETAQLDSEFKQSVRDVRSYTARIRSALKDLPNTAAEQAWNMSSDKRELTELLQEIIGSASAIAEIAGIEL